MKKRISAKMTKQLMTVGIAVVAGMLALVVALAISKPEPEQREPEIITVASLQKVVRISELSTYTATYDGVAKVYNAEKPDELDYCVSYKAKVKAGINVEDITIEVDHEQKRITITLPVVQLDGKHVDISTLDFIFYNDQANTETVIQSAYKACEEDVQRESEENTVIGQLAKESAVNIITALVRPIVDQLDGGYTLVVE